MSATETVEHLTKGTVITLTGDITEIDIAELSRRLEEDEALNVYSEIAIHRKDGVCGRVTWVDAEGYVEFDAIDDNPHRDGRQEVAVASEIDQLEIVI